MEKLFGWLAVFAVLFFPWQYAVMLLMYAYTADTAVSHSVCVVFRSTFPAFSLSTTRQHTHIRTQLLCEESVSIAIINTSIAAWHIKSLSEIPALHVLSTKWHSLLPALIPHSVIRAHLLQSLFGRQFLNWMSLSQHCSRAFATTDTRIHTLPPPWSDLTSSKSRWKPPTCLRTGCRACLTVC